MKNTQCGAQQQVNIKTSKSDHKNICLIPIKPLSFVILGKEI